MKKLDRLIFTFLYINIIILFSSAHLIWRMKIPSRSISYKSQQLIKMGLTYRLMQRLESLLKENQKKLNRLVFTFLCNNIVIHFFSSAHLFWRMKIPSRSISYKSQQLNKMGLTYRLMQKLESLWKEN